MFLKRCLNCRRPDKRWLCRACWQQVVPLEQPCPVCALPLAQFECSFCRTTGLACRHLAYGPYQGMLQNLLYQIKYHGRQPMAFSLGEYLGEWLAPQGLAVDLVIPVPLHTERLASRGYNQAWLLAQGIARRLARPCLSPLVRLKATPPLHPFSPAERRLVLQDGFALPDKYLGRLAGKNILLVDDILTTGATLTTLALYLQQRLPIGLVSLSAARVQKIGPGV